MFNKNNNVSFVASDVVKGLPAPHPAYRSFPEWFINSNSQSKCPFRSIMKANQVLNRFKPSTDRSQLEIVKVSTVKNCPGIVDYLKTGYVLPAWCDMIFRDFNGEMIWQPTVNVPGSHYGLHRSDQFVGMNETQCPVGSMFHKVSSPWYIKTSPGVSVLITDPYWNRNKNFTSVSAVVHPDIYPIQLQWFFEFNQKLQNNTEIYDESLQVIKKDTPLALIIPFKRTNFNHSVEYLNSDEMSKLTFENSNSSASWFTESLYDKARRTFNIWYK